MNRKVKSMMKFKIMTKLLTLALLATACAAQKAPPISSAQIDETQPNANAKATPPNSDDAEAPVALQSITWTRTGGGDLKFLIEQKPEGKCISAKVIEKDFKSVDQSIEMESEALAEGVQAIFAGTLKVEALQTDSGTLTGTWTELTLVDSKGQSKSIKTPVINDEKHAELLQDLEDAVREQMEKSNPDSTESLD
jgi:hypothetical protein